MLITCSDFFSVSVLWIFLFPGDYLLVNKNKMLWVFLCWKGNKMSPNSFPPLATHTPSQLSQVHTGRHNKQTITCWKTHLKTERSHYPWVLGNINLVFGKQLTVEGWGFSLFYSRTKTGRGGGTGRESFENKREEIITVVSYRNKCFEGPPTSNPDLTEWRNACMNDWGGKKNATRRKNPKWLAFTQRVQRCAWAFLE